MAQRPTHSLNLLLVPDDPERLPDDDELQRVWDKLVSMGIIGPLGRPGPEASRLGHFSLLRIDRPPGPAVYGNRQGGFRVRCPRCGMALARPFSSAARRWKLGGPRRLTCPGCGADLDLVELIFAPPAALARFAIELREVAAASLDLDPELLGLLRSALGGEVRVIASRGG